MKTHKWYNLQLPVFKQGDDLAHQIEKASSLSEAFINQAENYQWAAEMCKRMAEVCKNDPNIKIDACTHMISVFGDEGKLDMLVKEDLLSVDEFEDEDEDFDNEEE